MPIFQLGFVHVPVDGVALDRVKPTGSASVTTTFVALLGPLFVAVIVNVTVLLTLKFNGLILFKTVKSVTGTGVVLTDEQSLAETGSELSPLIHAVLMYGPVAFTVAVIVNVAEAPLAKFPMFQFGLVHVPVLATGVPTNV